MHIDSLSKELRVGDIVFIHIDILPFRKIAKDTQSWTNHVGIIIDVAGDEPIVAESTFPRSTTTPFSKFLKRSKDHRVAIKRLHDPLSTAQQAAIKEAANKKLGRWYDTGFNLHSRKQFCSRYVHEVVSEALNIELGTIENMRTLLTNNPKADLLFWRIWYFGRIPWERETVTPASILHSPKLHSVFDGTITL
ncbi:MAG: YebB family permuted papain-like enzyme [Alphaproteobacteria bacterium]|nr:MAG: YebB family permuted papain-like enzyme [Alphaproteobacteria bacterium]